jgi:cyclic pyranopterin phosphate synthase
MEKPFSHIARNGMLRMVDVGHKRVTKRQASASCVVHTVADMTKLVPSPNEVDPWHAARLAGTLAAKGTSTLIPLCHPLSLSDIHVTVDALEGRVEVGAMVSALERTGVEMEALTACAVAALSIVDSLLDLDPCARIDDLVLLSKTGGKSGPWGRLVGTSESDNS